MHFQMELVEPNFIQSPWDGSSRTAPKLLKQLRSELATLGTLYLTQPEIYRQPARKSRFLLDTDDDNLAVSELLYSTQLDEYRLADSRWRLTYQGLLACLLQYSPCPSSR